MHSLNLGYVLWLLGGAIVYLANIKFVWGDGDPADRFMDAWLEFHAWTKQRKIQHLEGNICSEVRSTFSMDHLFTH